MSRLQDRKIMFLFIRHTMYIIEEIQNNFFVAFVVAFIVFYNIFIQKDAKITFFVVVTFIILYTMYSKNKKIVAAKLANVDQFIETMASRLNDDSEVAESTIFYIHKNPRSLKYLKQTDDFKKIIHDLKFVNVYDKSSYSKLISYVEYFLKIHYKVMIGKYEYDSYFPVMKDIRNEILNIMKAIHFNIPNISRIIDIKNIDEFLDSRIVAMQSKTYRYIKVLQHKYGTNKHRYQAPFEYDSSKDKNYHLF